MPRAARPWCWTTTWRCWPASPARCPARPRWSQARAAGDVHQRARGVLGRGPQGPRRRRRHPRAGRGAAAAPPPRPADVVAGITAALAVGASAPTSSPSRPADTPSRQNASRPTTRSGRGQPDQARRPAAADRPAAAGLPTAAVGRPPTTAAHRTRGTHAARDAATTSSDDRRDPTSDRLRAGSPAEQATDAAIDQACRLLRLPTIRARSARSPPPPNGAADLPGVPGRAAARRVRRPGPPPLRPPGQGRRLPAGEVAGRLRLRREPQRQPGHHPHPGRLRLGPQGQPLCLIGDSGTGKSHLLIGAGHRRRPGRATGSVHPGREARQRARRGRRREDS